MVLFSAVGMTRTYADESRWVWVDTLGPSDWYVDKSTIKRFSPYNTDMQFWVKTESDTDDKWLYRYDVLSMFWPLSRYAVSKNLNHTTSFHPVHPGSIQEKSINTALALSGGGTIFSQMEHNWKWIYSDDYVSYSICTDANYYNKYDNSIFVYVVGETIQHVKNRSYYRIYLNEPSVYKGEDRYGAKLEIVPESFAEAIFNAGKELAQNQ